MCFLCQLVTLQLLLLVILQKLITSLGQSSSYHHRLLEIFFDFKHVSCEEVQRIISSLPLNKSPGPDKIHIRVYRDCLPVILGPLTEIINSSLASAKYPDAWKFSEVTPLLREGDHEVASNNQPLSLLAVAC